MMAGEKNNGIYYDIEDVVETETIADDAIAESDWYNNMYWVRKFLFKVRANGAYDIILYKRSKNEIADIAKTIIKRATATGATTYISTQLEDTCGYSFKIGIQNRSGGNLEVQASVELFRD
jgi:hypothetical protein